MADAERRIKNLAIYSEIFMHYTKAILSQYSFLCLRNKKFCDTLDTLWYFILRAHLFINFFDIRILDNVQLPPAHIMDYS